MSSNGGFARGLQPAGRASEYVFRPRTYTPAVGSSPARWIDGAVVTARPRWPATPPTSALVPDLRNSPFPGQTSRYGDVRLACRRFGNGHPAYSASLWDRNRMGDLQFDYAQGASTSVLNTRVELLRAAPAVRDGFCARGGHRFGRLQPVGPGLWRLGDRHLAALHLAPQANRPEALGLGGLGAQRRRWRHVDDHRPRRPCRCRA